MARAKKASRVLTDAEKRLVGMRTVDAKLSFGGDISVPVLEKKILTVRQKLAAYNQLLSEVDEIYEEVLDAEQDLSKLSSKLLAGVGIKYGKKSSEYETVVGVRRRSTRRSEKVAVGAS